MARSTLLFSFVMLLMHLVRKKKLQVVDRLNSVSLTSSRRGRGRVTFLCCCLSWIIIVQRSMEQRPAVQIW